MAQDISQSFSLCNSSPTKIRFGTQSFDPDEELKIHNALQQKIGSEHLSYRPGPGGKKLTYIESCKAINLANEVFHYNGWSSYIKSLEKEFIEKKDGRISAGYSAVVKVVLKDGTSHEDIGFGQVDNAKDYGKAIENAKKAAISDARKRALRCFGEYLGNSVYDREYLNFVNKKKLEGKNNYSLPLHPDRSSMEKSKIMINNGISTDRSVKNNITAGNKTFVEQSVSSERVKENQRLSKDVVPLAQPLAQPIINNNVEITPKKSCDDKVINPLAGDNQNIMKPVIPLAQSLAQPANVINAERNIRKRSLANDFNQKTVENETCRFQPSKSILQHASPMSKIAKLSSSARVQYEMELSLSQINSIFD